MSKKKWDVWEELEELRLRQKELAPIFAQIGVAPELVQMANSIRLDLQRKPAAEPLMVGDRDKDAQALEEYERDFINHFEEIFFKINSILRMPWPPETKFMVAPILEEVEHLRRLLVKNSTTVPPLEKIDQLVQQYVSLDKLNDPKLHEAITRRKVELAEILGFPLIVRRQLAHPEWEILPSLASDDYSRLLASKIEQYRDAEWLQNVFFDKWLVALEFDAIWARLKRDSNDRQRIIDQLRLNWPKLGTWLPQFLHADLVWYLLLVIACLVAMIADWWFTAAFLVVWLTISVTVEKHHIELVNKRRQALLLECGRFKRLRDQIVSGRFIPGMVLRQVKQFNFRHYVSDACMGLLLSTSMRDGK